MVKTKQQYLALRTFGTALMDISQTTDADKITKISLLTAKPITMLYCGGMIQSINRTVHTADWSAINNIIQTADCYKDRLIKALIIRLSKFLISEADK